MVLIDYQSLDATEKWKMVNQHDFDQTEINSANTIILKNEMIIRQMWNLQHPSAS